MSLPHEIEAFVRVVERGNFAAASSDLGLTPSAVSKIITRLENRLGVSLLTRTTRRLALTAEGETYLLRSREILKAIEAAEAEISFSGGRLTGSLRITAGTALGRNYLIPLVPEFLSDHPDLEIELFITDRQIDILAENVDIALRAGTLPDSSMVARKVADAHRVICASPDYLERFGWPLKPDDLMHHNCLRMSEFAELAKWPFRIANGIRRVEVTGNISTDNADTMLDLAIVGHGIVRMTDIHVKPSVKKGLLVPLLTDRQVDHPIPISAITLPGRNRIPRVRMFLDFLFERLGGAPWSLQPVNAR